MTWQAVSISSAGCSVVTEHETRDEAAERTAARLVALAQLRWNAGRDEEVPSLLRAAEDFLLTLEGEYLYTAPAGGRWLIKEA